MSSGKLYILQHVPYETPGMISDWLKEKGKENKEIHLYKGDELPTVKDMNGLVIMGGPMGVYDEAVLPWMKKEKDLIKDCIDQNIPVLGVCLGAQLIADVLGSDVYRHKYQEIGWMPVESVYDGEIQIDGEEQIVFHWHGDTYDLPEGSVQLFESKGCGQQGFQFKDHVIGLQFHLEIGRSELEAMEEQVKASLTKGPYVQSWDEIIEVEHCWEISNRKLLYQILEKLFS